ncbi:aminotransferase class I/II-fold pyridoxal phosphate-dependent enzyme [Streptomyces sp. ISL-99]|uniref:aminotransferase class I/II-fold pyridoxal phosphate-dependent enzyme n=1 Tax=Streptomyces sp. ISL-99 TaxID=2819193 RepID=UPI001BEA483F|nr:aminotransferase class I/II-fold pyridoxal phosphate-dependent enzyme [Streptomyces sp. ISL-99]MBT2525714.1 aminotransferase class I/II-fold pyridoxal phosphate-dependent enzyme [Streptomyces sp. ISL-99]
MEHLLTLNENPLPPLASVAAEIARHITDINRYPEFYPERLKGIIADWLELPTDAVVVGSGSVGVALQALQASVRPGGGLAYAWRNFDAYPLLAEMAGARAIEVPLLPGGHQDLDALGKAAVDADAVIVCNPHNPTGRLVPADQLKEFIALVPADTLIVLDEAYVEFVDSGDRPDSVEWVREFPNLLVLRTFSKAYGLANMRVGYGVANPVLAQRIGRYQLPFAMGSLPVVAVETSLREQRELEERVEFIVRERDRVAAKLSRSWNVLPSHTNFLWFDEPERTEDIRRALERHGVRARYFEGEGVRLTVGDTDANNAVLQALT